MKQAETEGRGQKAEVKKKTVFFDRALVAIFATLLLAPVVCQMFDVDLKSPPGDEKRKQREFPKLEISFRGLRTFPRGTKRWLGETGLAVAPYLRSFPHDFEGWFADHFGLRDALIRLHSAAVYFGLHSSPAPKVIVGKEGWLYYNAGAANDGTDSIADYRGTKPLTKSQLEVWRWEFQDEHDWCAAHGISYFLGLVPSKEEVYPEYLPDWMTRLTAKTALGQLADHLGQKAKFPWIDVTPALLEGRKRDRVFLLTDTHWSRYGAYCGYRAMLSMVTNVLPSVSLPDDSTFELSHDNYISGDLSQIMALRPVMGEDYVLMKSRTPPRATVKKEEGRDLPDVVTDIPDPKLPRALIFRDSFTEDLIPFLSENFQHVVFRWARTGIDFKLIQREKPDVVMQITSDRLLRKGQRYPAEMRDFCAQQRFAAATNVLLDVRNPHAAGRTEIRTGTNGWIVTASGDSPRIELGEMAGDPGEMLPIVRLDVTMSSRADLYLVWHDSRGDEQTLREALTGGRHEIFLPMIDPDVRGPLLLEFGRRSGDYILHAAEVRAIPR